MQIERSQNRLRDGEWQEAVEEVREGFRELTS